MVLGSTVSFDNSSNGLRLCSLIHGPNLKLVTKTRGIERCRPKMQPKNHIHTFKSAREYEGMNHTLPSGFPLWELKSQWTFEFPQSNWRVKIH
jgi:hypothetical protein